MSRSMPAPLFYGSTFLMYLAGAVLIGFALLPSFFLALKLWDWIRPESLLARALVMSLSSGLGFFIFGLALATLTVVCIKILSLELKEGEFGYFSMESMRWALANGLMLAMNAMFMDFMRLTPLLPLFLRFMGAKVGKRVEINTRRLSDISLLEIGDGAVIGGDAVIIGHIAEGGRIKFKKVRIGPGAEIGMEALVMPGCRIGGHAVVAARSVLLKDTIVPPRTLFAGAPAKWIKDFE